MRSRILLVVVAVTSLSGVADGAFVLVLPAASLVQTGSPIRIRFTCGGVSANPTRNTPANPGTPANAVTQLTGGLPSTSLSGTVFHPGHYRVALARTMAQLPPDLVVTTRDSDRGPWSVSAAIQSSPEAPVLADGLFVHTSGRWA